MSPIKILLVEDNEGDIVLTLEALKEGKIEKDVTVARDGQEAIDHIENSGKGHAIPEPDLILLDVNLPKINGHEVLSRIKNNNDKKHIPIVMFTTSSTESDIVASYISQASRYIAKPIDADDYSRVTNSIEDFWRMHLSKLNS